MHKFKKIIFTLIIFLLTTISVDAASTCGVQEKSELNKEVANIKVNYEIVEEKIKDENLAPSDDLGPEDDLTYTVSSFKINITNLSSKFYAIVTNDYDSNTLTFFSKDADESGVVSFKWDDVFKITNFKIKIYASSETGCQGDEYKTLYLTTPRYNEYSNYILCSAVPDYYLCQKYVTFEDNVNFDTFITKTEKEIQKRKNEDSNNPGDNGDDGVIDNTVSFINKHKVSFIVGGIIIVVVAIGTTFIIIRKRRRDEV